MEPNMNLVKLADAHSTVYSNKLYENFDDPSPINVEVTKEDYSAGYCQGTIDATPRQLAVKDLVQELVEASATADGFYDMHDIMYRIILCNDIATKLVKLMELT